MTLPLWLIPAFFVTAALYAAVGFGGGSSYTALLVLAGVAVAAIPPISLACNLLVAGGGTIRLARAGLMPWRRAGMLVATAAPFAFLGGLTPVKEGVLVLLLGGSLVISALALAAQPKERAKPLAMPDAALIPVCMALGYLAGVVGIGGGIFLAPILHVICWAKTRQIAATASLFIFVNSLFGLAGQLVKGAAASLPSLAQQSWPLLLAVLIGGAIGSRFAIRGGTSAAIRLLTAALTAFAGARLLIGF